MPRLRVMGSAIDVESMAWEALSYALTADLLAHSIPHDQMA